MPPNFEPHMNPTPPPQPPERPTVPPPVPNPLRQDHSMPIGEQHSIDTSKLPRNSADNLFQPSAPTTANPSYDFMLNQTQPTKAKISLPKGSIGKVAVVLGGLVVFIILFAIISSLFKGPSNAPYLDSVISDQQELIHIANVASSASDISSNNQTFISTAYTVLSSNSSELQAYLASQGAKVSTLVLNQKISKATDTELNNAEQAGTFNSTFAQVARTDLNTYMQDINTAYSKITGKHGRALLVSFYKQANLLLVSLNNGS